MVIARGDIVWVDFGSARGSEPALSRPALVMQENWLTATDIRTVLVAPLTSNTALEAFPGNVLIASESSGLERDSVVVVSQITAIHREHVDPHPAGHVPAYLMKQISDGVRLVLGL